MVASAIINLLNIIYLVLENKTNINNILSTIICYILLTSIIVRLELDSINVISFVTFTIFYLLANHNKKNNSKSIKNTNQIVYNILTTIILFSMSDNSLKLFICSIAYALINYTSCYITNKEDSKFDIYYQPVVLLLAASSICQILSEVININGIYPFTICIIIYNIIYYLSKDSKIKNVYSIYLIIITILTFLINMEFKNIITGIITVISSSFLYKEKKNSIWSYIMILLSILFLGGILQEHFSPVLVNILNIVIFIVLTYIFKDNIKLKRINLFSILIPLYSLINSTGIDGDIKTIILNIYTLYIALLILILFIKEDKNKDIFVTISTSLIMLFIIFESSLLIGLYIGIIGILLVFLTYNRKDYKGLFYCGISLTILNIIVQLGEFWSKVPLGIYLLIVGIGIILFVTNNEIKKQKEPKQPNEYEKEETENFTMNKPLENNHNHIEEQTTNFCSNCGSKNVGNKFCTRCGNSLIIKK